MNRVSRRKIRLAVEGMEARVTPVGFFTPAQALYMELQRDHALGAAAARAHPQPAPAPILSGRAVGSFRVTSPATSPVTTVTVTGGGFLSPLGAANAWGQLSFRETSVPGTLEGTLILYNNKGSLTLLVSDRLGRTEIPPVIPSASVVVERGTGAFANLRGSGTATIDLGINLRNPSTGTTSITFHNIKL